MKYLLLVLCIAFLSCKVDHPYKSGDNLCENMEGVKNGEEWIGCASANYNFLADSLISIGLNVKIRDDYPFLYDDLRFFKVPLKQGYYPISKTTWDTLDGLVGARYYIVDYDIGYYNHHPLYSFQPNYIRIENINYDEGLLKGSFFMVMVEDTNFYTSIEEQDTMYVEGTFKCDLPK